jgi:hypothetical protein
MRLQNKIYYTALVAIMMVAGIVSCKKYNNWQEDESHNRLFRPSQLTASIDVVTVTLTWKGKPATTHYILELSKDSLQFAQIVKSYKLVPTRTADGYAFIIPEPLESATQYSARLKGQDTATGIPDSEWATVAFKTQAEQLMFAVTPGELTPTSAKLRWKIPNEVTHFMLGTVKYDITAAEKAAGEKIITGLTPATVYTASIYRNTTVRGSQTFTTKSQIAGSVIDLTNIGDRPSVLADTLPLIAPGSIVLLKRGYTYNIATTLSLSKTVTIMSGDDLATSAKATIFLASNFNIVAGSTIDSLVFKDVILKSDSYSGKYVFNVSNACTIGKMRFDDCQAEIFRGMVRLQTAVINVTTFTINNCIIDSISNYGVVNVDNVNCKIDDIFITNSTLYKAEKIVTSRQNSRTVVMENCTVNEAPWGNNYLIDYSTSGTNNVTQGIKVNNCIFGIGKNNSGVTDVRGIRANATTAIESNGNYNTSDYKPTATTPFPIPNLNAYTKSSTEIWRSPQTGDFTIIDNFFPGKATSGDPRWR